MSTKATSKKSNAATPKAPPVVYVEIDDEGIPVSLDENPNNVEDARDSDSRLARYTFSSFVTVEFKAVVTDVAA